MLGLGILALAHGGGWEPGEARALAVGVPTTEVVVAPFDGSPSLIVAGPDGVSVRGGPELAEIAVLALPVTDLQPTDLDGDGTVEVLACGPSGVHALRATSADFGAPIELAAGPCVSLAAFRVPSDTPGIPALGHLVRWDGTALAHLSPGGDGLVAEALSLPEGFGTPRIAGNGRAYALAGRKLVMVDGSARGEADLDGPVAGLAPDGEGFAVALGAPAAIPPGEDGSAAEGPGPRLVLASGAEVPLPSAPRWLAAPALTGDADLLVGLEDRSVLLRLGADGTPRVTALPARADAVASGDLDGDGCNELVLLEATGAEGAVVKGVCAPPVADGEVVLGAEWAQLAAEVGVPTRIQLVDGVRGWTGFERRGGPDRVTVHPDGRLEFTPTPADVGIWRMSVRITDGISERWTGLVVRVKGDPGADSVVKTPAVVDTVEETAPGDRNNVVAKSRRTGFLGFKECMAAAGVAAGASRNQGLAWSNIGLPDVVPSASPAVSLACNTGSDRVRFLAGVDSAPTFFYLGKNGRLNHILAATIGVEARIGALRVGPVASAGLVIVGVGGRLALVPFETRHGGRHGFEARLLAYPLNLSGQGLLAYTWEFGEF